VILPAGPDALGDEVAALERAGQSWLDRAADAVDRTREVPVEEVQALMEEGRRLKIDLKEELEELGERCEVYCLCQTAYDAARPMISCDKCEGWFHYECCDMRPPSEEEPEDADAHFKCPKCCDAEGTAYVPFRPPPIEKNAADEDEDEAAAAAAAAAGHDQNPAPSPEEAEAKQDPDSPPRSDPAEEAEAKDDADAEADAAAVARPSPDAEKKPSEDAPEAKGEDPSPKKRDPSEAPPPPAAEDSAPSGRGVRRRRR
jgi:histone demethylase JARID1